MAKNSPKLSLSWPTQSLLHLMTTVSKPKSGRKAFVHVQATTSASVPKKWSKDFFTNHNLSPLRVSDGSDSVKLLVSPQLLQDIERNPRLKSTPSIKVRDGMGLLVSTLEKLEISSAEIDLDLPKEQLDAAITGLEMALYRYKRVLNQDEPKFQIELKVKGKAQSKEMLVKQTALGQGMNLSRHLVNLPPNQLNPETYADLILQLFGKKGGFKCEVWDESRLRQEGMGLHLAVGAGSSTPSRLVHLEYRPAGAQKKKPLAFVGKGITFDSGGLDIKSASGMRLMKKDMGGSAAVIGLAYWAALAGVKQPMDFYVALAENSIGSRSFRPSDVITARNGLKVEIHNTDAEGRLVLADALDVAITAKVKPQIVVNVATLTGAIKSTLGSSLAGLFSNDAKLAASLQAAGQVAGDPMWEIPLMQKYAQSFSSNFADLVNATDGFGGAITAALFLERFVGDVPWAHLDIFAWKDSSEGAWLESGGSGQAVCALKEWVCGRRI